MKVFGTVLVAGLISAASASAENAIIDRAVNGFLRPAYAELHASTTRLKTGVQDLCRSSGEAQRRAAHDDFLDTVKAWSTVESIRFGPVTEENRLERFLFWPDRKGIGLRQVQAALAEQDPSAIDPSALAKKSVAMQGLGALEFVLFGTGSEDLLAHAGAYRCSYGLAIATNLDVMAAEVSAAWSAPDGIARQWANPGPGNPLYRDDAEALTELLNVFVHGLEMIRDVRINGFLGETGEEDRPRQAIYWRSGATVLSIRAALDGLAKLQEAAALLPRSGDNGWIAEAIDFEFANADRTLRLAEGPIGDVVANPERRGKLAYARIVTSSLSELFGARLAPALGLTAGFSSLDGD